MKASLVLGMIALCLGSAACNKVASENEAESTTSKTAVDADFTNLETGEPVNISTDKETGYALDAKSGEPVEFYVNMNTMDTFYGRTGTVVNNAIFLNETGYYQLDEDKIKWEDDSMTVVGTDANTRAAVKESEANKDSAKVKVDEDELKIKQGNQKIKVEDGKSKVKR
ncbi:hypothetical protein [Polluticoccus soli]|uniref:hypothetical protein n=1 Tax=Polluticoccus soli TaxID=3034150 RepID=UPI0023E1C8FD|nr:hypothetical protein [Flavipsychrobacter sp. JY13-12]